MPLRRGRTLIALVSAGVAMAGCSFVDVNRLAGDDTGGRDNGTAGSTKARQYLIEQLKPIAEGLNAGPPATRPISRRSAAAPTSSP